MGTNDPFDEQNIMTLESLNLEGPRSNEKQVLSIIKNITKAKYVSEITDFDK